MLKKPDWQVRLGPMEWQRYTYARPADDALTLLGSVKKGMQVGALAANKESQYFQVVGDHLTLLNTNQITKALAKAKAPDHSALFRTPAPLAAPPVVTVKKRRTFVKE